LLDLCPVISAAPLPQRLKLTVFSRIYPLAPLFQRPTDSTHYEKSSPFNFFPSPTLSSLISPPFTFPPTSFPPLPDPVKTSLYGRFFSTFSASASRKSLAACAFSGSFGRGLLPFSFLGPPSAVGLSRRPLLSRVFLYPRKYVLFFFAASRLSGLCFFSSSLEGVKRLVLTLISKSSPFFSTPLSSVNKERIYDPLSY